MKDNEIFVMVCEATTIEEMEKNITTKKGNTYVRTDRKPIDCDVGMDKDQKIWYVWHDHNGWQRLAPSQKELDESKEFCKIATEITRKKHFKNDEQINHEEEAPPESKKKNKGVSETNGRGA